MALANIDMGRHNQVAGSVVAVVAPLCLTQLLYLLLHHDLSLATSALVMLSALVVDSFRRRLSFRRFAQHDQKAVGNSILLRWRMIRFRLK